MKNVGYDKRKQDILQNKKRNELYLDRDHRNLDPFPTSENHQRNEPRRCRENKYNLNIDYTYQPPQINDISLTFCEKVTYHKSDHVSTSGEGGRATNIRGVCGCK